MYEYIQGDVIKSVVLFACKSALSPQEVITEFNSMGQFLVSIQIFLFEEGFWEDGWAPASEGTTGNGLYGSFPNGFWALTKYNDGIDHTHEWSKAGLRYGGSILALPDLSVAFGTIDYFVLDWLKSLGA